MGDPYLWLHKYLFVLIISTLHMRGECGRFRCPSAYGMFPHYTDCSRFYVCSMWSVFSMKCAMGLHFNPEIEVCDWVNNVECFTESGKRGQTESEKNLAKVAGRMGAIQGKLAADVTTRLVSEPQEEKGERYQHGSRPLVGGKSLVVGNEEKLEPTDYIDGNVYRPVVVKAQGSHPAIRPQEKVDPRPIDNNVSDSDGDEDKGSGSTE